LVRETPVRVRAPQLGLRPGPTRTSVRSCRGGPGTEGRKQPRRSPARVHGPTLCVSWGSRPAARTSRRSAGGLLDGRSLSITCPHIAQVDRRPGSAKPKRGQQSLPPVLGPRHYGNSVTARAGQTPRPLRHGLRGGKYPPITSNRLTRCSRGSGDVAGFLSQRSSLKARHTTAAVSRQGSMPRG
jgi:hypothetical protein